MGVPQSKLTNKITRPPICEALREPTVTEKIEAKGIIGYEMPNVKLTEIKTVKNNFLEAMYSLTKEECITRNKTVQEMLLLHVTSSQNIHSICKDNFDWRKCRRGKFGHGVSFSPSFKYANDQANHRIGNHRAVIVTKVLVSKKRAGRKRIIPHIGYDTTTGNREMVYVKFNDNEMLPLYVAYFYYDTRKAARSNNAQTMAHQQDPPCVIS